MTILVVIHDNTRIPEYTNTPVEPAEAFKTIVSDITEALPFLIAPISYEPKTVLLHLEYLKQELIDASATYKSSLTHPNKALLIAINVPLKTLAVHLKEHKTHYSMVLNLKPALKDESTIKTNRLQKSKNHLYDFACPTTPSGSCTTTSSSDVCITDKMNTRTTNSPPTAVSFPTHTPNQDTPPSIYPVPTLQVRKYVTHILNQMEPGSQQ